METVFLSLGGILIFILTGRIVLDIAPPPTDVAPPPTLLAGVGLVVLAALCAFVILIGVVAFFVIRAIRKNRLVKQTPPPTQEPPQNS